MSPLLDWPYSKAETTNAGKDVTKQESLYTAEGLQISITIMKSSMDLLIKAKDRTAI
jgi:hypothetical protein